MDLPPCKKCGSDIEPLVMDEIKGPMGVLWLECVDCESRTEEFGFWPEVQGMLSAQNALLAAQDAWKLGDLGDLDYRPTHDNSTDA